MGVVGGMDLNNNEIWPGQIDNNQTLYRCYGNNGKESWMGEKVQETWVIIVCVHTYIHIRENRSCRNTFLNVYVQTKVFISTLLPGVSVLMCRHLCVRG